MDEIKNLIPYVCENFVTFPLSGEGDYRPFVNVWLDFDKLPECISDGCNIDLLDIDESAFNDMDKFDVMCNVEERNETNRALFGIIIKKKKWYHVEFSIFNSLKFSEDEDLHMWELIFIANYLVKHFKK